MFAHSMIAGSSTALCLVLAIFYYSIACRAGWQHYQSFCAIPLASAGYGVLALLALGGNGYHYQSPMRGAIAVAIGFLTGILWLRFDAARRRRQRSPLERGIEALLALAIVLCLIPGVMLSAPVEISESWFGLAYHVPVTTNLANLFIMAWLLMMAQLTIRFLYGAYFREDSWACVIGCGLFFLGGLEDSLVAGGLLCWPFLGLVAYALASLVMAMDLAIRIARNAIRLESLNTQLQLGIERRSEELVGVRRALILTERHAAVGKLATGLSHEINNPLSYIAGNLDYLNDQIGESDDTKQMSSALAAIADAQLGATTIRRVVEELSAYARNTPAQGGRSVEISIATAIRIVGQQSKFPMGLSTRGEEVPEVTLDESSLAQVLVSLLIRVADRAAGRENEASMHATCIIVGSEGGEAVITIASSERGDGDATSEGQRSKRRSGTRKAVEVISHDVAHCRYLTESAGGTLEIGSEQRKRQFEFRIRLPFAEGGGA